MRAAANSERGLLRTPQARTAGSGFRVRGKRDSGAGAEPTDEIPVGTVGTFWQEGIAVSQRGALRGERGGWEDDVLRRATEGWRLAHAAKRAETLCECGLPACSNPSGQGGHAFFEERLPIRLHPSDK